MKTKPSPTSFFKGGKFLFALFFLVTDSILAQLRFSKEHWFSTTYPVNPSDKNLIFLNDESCQFASKVNCVCALNDMISNKKTNSYEK